MTELRVVQGDITKLVVGAIVNAANKSLLGGGGVDGAIHKVAGKELLGECRLLQGCDTGDAKITQGYDLSAKHVIHTVGPVWKGGLFKEEELLKNCYIRSLEVAQENRIRSIAFPCISTGIYYFPKKRAAEIATQTVIEFIDQNTVFEEILFVCFSGQDYDLYKSLGVEDNM